ncbi:MAG: peptidyl-prolyl cis-trans isomerase [Muribaculaceae bacterium]|nr:peptidyl-prolyl cis-trans isomerase [Muribaculaceae bacterium]
MKTKLLAGIGLSAFALALAAKDAVIMKVNGVDIPKSEFEYLYHKNAQQQMTPQSIEEYAELFKLYKLKVAEAKAAGLDTLSSFRSEMAQYRHELAAPYMSDTTFINKLLDETMDRSKEEVETKHIMFFKGRDPKKAIQARHRADSVLKVLKAGGNFEELAKLHSEDMSSNSKEGYMGYIPAMKYPYAFETVAYKLKEGEISDVVESPVGYHILKGGKHRPASGRVLASHILIMAQPDSASLSKAYTLSDSLYRIVKADPSKFEDIARRFSDDKGSAVKGGKLDWFGRGVMVQEFDSVAFALPDGEISEPFKTRFGYHIIYRHDHQGGPSREEIKPRFMSMVNSSMDPRSKMIRDDQTVKLEKKNKGKLYKETLSAMKADVAVTGLDSAFYAKWNSAPAVIFCQIGSQKHPVKEFITFLGNRINTDPVTSADLVEEGAAIFYNSLLQEAEEENLLKTHPDYANLYREYVDGSLLYELSLREVWDKAAKDEDGLRKYFEANREKYHWTEPRAKGYLVQAVSDSIADAVMLRAGQIGRDSLIQTVRKEFPKDVSITKVLEPKGSNTMVDNVLFGGPEVQTPGKFKVYFMLDPRVINDPEELNDVKGVVTSDYQNVLQKQWEADLLNKYPVVVNEKVLKSVKPLKAKN